MYREKRRNKIIILILVGIICLMGAGYAAFSSQLNITGTSNITSTWDVRITNIESELYGAEDIEEPSYDNTNGLFASFSTGLKRPGDYALYTVTIENMGDIDARIEKINTYYKENKYITFTLSGLSKGDVIKGKETKELQVKVEFNSNVTSIEENISVDLDVSIDVAQDSDNPLPANDYYVTYDYEANGGESTNAVNDYVSEGSNVNLEYTATKAGYEFMGWNTDKGATVGLESLNMPSNNVILYAIFRKIDTTPPVISNVSTSSTTSSITIVTTAIEEDGEIVKYEYKIDNEEYVEGESNTYTFTGLTQNTSHTIKVRVINRDNLQVESEEYNVSTKELNIPTFSEEETDSGKTVTITYPEGAGLTYEYQKDGGSWQKATQSQEIEFTESGTLVARVSDGTNTVNSTYTVNVGISIQEFINSIPKVTNGDGLYVDSYEDGRYVYKGSNPNNYIIFNNELWRIISIERDNTLKIIKNNVLYEERAWESTNSNDWEKSDIKNYLNNVYYETLNPLIKNYIVLHNWSIGEVSSANGDLITQISNENEVKSSGDRVGLISVSDYLRANSNTLCNTFFGNNAGYKDCITTNWLYDSDNSFYWTISPESGSSNETFIIMGSVGSAKCYIDYKVRPAIYISSEVKIASGNGSQNNPYTLTL